MSSNLQGRAWRPPIREGSVVEVCAGRAARGSLTPSQAVLDNDGRCVEVLGLSSHGVPKAKVRTRDGEPWVPLVVLKPVEA